MTGETNDADTGFRARLRAHRGELVGLAVSYLVTWGFFSAAVTYFGHSEKSFAFLVGIGGVAGMVVQTLQGKNDDEMSPRGALLLGAGLGLALGLLSGWVGKASAGETLMTGALFAVLYPAILIGIFGLGRRVRRTR